MNTLYYGDNLDILRKYINDESVDLIYLDPPFNSQRAYNVIFPDKSGKFSTAQIHAFEDAWSWGIESQQAFDDIMRGSYSLELKDMMKAFKEFMGPSNLMAYLTMMAVRLVEMHRTLKMTGSLYLHCDPTASHYLKVLLDQIFGQKNFRNEIVWKRTDAKGNVQKKFGWIHDRLLFYTKTNRWTWNQQFVAYDQEYTDQFYAKVDKNGRRYQADNLTAPMSRASRGQIYTWKGYTPPSTRCFVYNKEKMEQLDREGRIEYTSKGCPRLIRYLDEMEGNKCPDIWLDIRFPQKSEQLPYPTQKPVALLERIIQASSDEGDVVMDPFCGCGTATVAAEKLGRKWIGIDVTYLAIQLIKKRVIEHFPDAKFEEIGEPKSLEDARSLSEKSKFQFESWAVSLIGGQPYKSTGGGDTGMDGFLYFQDFEGNYHRIIIEVKGGGYQPKDVRSLAHVLQREESPMGILIALEPPTKGMLSAAAELGKWAMPVSRKSYPVMQIMTIQDFFDGKKPELPDTSETLKKAKREVREREKKKNQPKLGLEE
jgi:site-specific DNA-methyltransferase (adenine-specific)